MKNLYGTLNLFSDKGSICLVNHYYFAFENSQYHESGTLSVSTMI